ncbi:molecular chaperone HtpG [bacterium CPR1]|nr:molecular chaperone HtpG [bacterium CPR1]
MAATIERHEFQAEVRQLLELMVHSIYSNKDIFLRELISNASDALDKLRLESLTNSELEVQQDQLVIQLETDQAERTLTISDNGIGMSREEVVAHIGTIAKSGTAEFLKKLKESQSSADLIGQFGVGFYSSFMVADRVELITRRASEDGATRWNSTGDGTYALEEAERSEHGTTIILHLKPEDRENSLFDYTSEWKLREIVKRYSDFINYPIKLRTERKEVDKDEHGKPVEGAIPRTIVENEQLNSQKALWARPKEVVSADEYNQFYRHLSHDWEEPLRTMTLKAEGTFEYQALLFLPRHAPPDLYMREAKRGLQLYVKRVFIMDDCEELLPEYLRFVKGVVDAQDLSLNISREILQKDRHIQFMRKRLVKKVLETLEEMKSDADEDYQVFWREFGRALKEGIYSDHESREKLLDLALFRSTHDPEKLTTLADYVARMPEGQDKIYFLTGENLAALERSPHLEGFKAKGYEVLLMTDAVDEIWIGTMPTFQEKTFQSVAAGDVELAEENKEKREEFATLLAWMGGKLEAHIKEVRVSSRLTSSPACLVSDPNEIPPNLERLMRAMGQEVPAIKRILEVNPDHPLLVRMKAVYQAKPDDPALAEQSELLYGLAVLAEGGDLPDASRFTRLLGELMVKALEEPAPTKAASKKKKSAE